MEDYQAIGFGVAAFFFCWTCFFVLKVIFKFGEPYNTLREKMEELRVRLSIEAKSGRYDRKSFPSVITSFNEVAKKLRIPKFREM